MKHAKVLVVATSRKTRGGITSVVKAHEQGAQWREFHCHWVQTHRDGTLIRKLGYLTYAILDYAIRLPFYNIVHIHFSNQASLKRKLFFARMAKTLKKKILVHFHAFDPATTLQGSYSNKYKELLDMSDEIIVLSNWWKVQIINIFPDLENKIQTLYNPCEKVDSESRFEKKKMILYAGTVNSRKGYSDLIKAFAIISAKFQDWKLSIAGNGEIKQGIQLSEDLGISKQVEFLGWISGEKKEQIFRDSSIFCLPSYAEGFPMAVLDAWAYGLPVITTPVGGIPDIADDGNNMLLFNPGDINTLAKQLERLILNNELRTHLSQESKKLSETTFNIDTINDKLREIYSSL